MKMLHFHIIFFVYSEQVPVIFILIHPPIVLYLSIAQSAGAVEYTNCKNPAKRVS